MALVVLTRRQVLAVGAAALAAPATAAGLTDDDLQKLITGPDEARDKAADYVVDHPAAVDPMGYIYVVMSLWRRGDRARAAFWYYVWQIRTTPWLKAGKDPNYAAARGALGEVMGGVINPWVASDFKAWKDLVTRAIAFEKRAPLMPKRPDGLSQAQWRAVISRERAAWARDFNKTFAGQTAETFAASRRRNNLPVGPWDQPGRPLPDTWR